MIAIVPYFFIGYPKCPFLSSQHIINNNISFESSSSLSVYDGVGFIEDSLAFFPFSAGNRICLGRSLALDIMRKVLMEIASNYHLDPYESSLSFQEDDIGLSANACITILNQKAYVLKVRRILSLSGLVASDEGALDGSSHEGSDEGWAKEDDDDEEDHDDEKEQTGDEDSSDDRNDNNDHED